MTFTMGGKVITVKEGACVTGARARIRAIANAADRPLNTNDYFFIDGQAVLGYDDG